MCCMPSVGAAYAVYHLFGFCDHHIHGGGGVFSLLFLEEGGGVCDVHDKL